MDKLSLKITLTISWIIVALITVIALCSDASKILEAPYLTFLSFILVITVFHSPLVSLLSRGTLSIKWGDREISITEIEENIDTQYNDLESQLSDLASEISELKGQFITSETTDEEITVAPNLIEKIQSIFGLGSVASANIVFNLKHSKYKWRNQKTLIKSTGLSESEITEIVRAYPEVIIMSRAKSGNTIYRLTDQAKIRLSEINS